MIKDETLDYLGSLHGGDWSTDEKREKLYELVVQCSKDFPAPLLSVEIGCFAGVSAFCMAHAHKDLQNGFVVTIDSWDNVTPLEGTNSEVNNNWWKTLDIKSVFNAFLKSKERPEWSGYVNYLKGRSDSFAENFQDESITLFHQDGNHNVETITKELELWSKKVKTGGYWVADDTNWVEAVEGYAKLPLFGFELVEDFTTWQIWKKVGAKSVEPIKKKVGRKKKADSVAKEFSKLSPEVSNTDLQTSKAISETPLVDLGEPPVGSFAWMVLQGQKDKKETPEQVNKELNDINKGMLDDVVMRGSPTKLQKTGGMRIGKYNIKPLSIYLPDKYLPTDKWDKEYEQAKTYFAEQGIENIQWVAGIHAQAWGLTGRHPYLRNYPDAREYMGDAKVGCYLTHYILYCVMDAIDSDAFLVLETDCLFVDGWKEKAEQALKDVPDDWDFLYLGSCCAMDKEPVHVKGDVWHFPHRPNKPDYYPVCGHCMLIRKKAVKTLIQTQRDPCEPVDIALIFNAFPVLNVYAVLPRLATQKNSPNLSE